MGIQNKASLDRLSTCHPLLQKVFLQVNKQYDILVIEGHRAKEAQDKAFSEGKSKLKWPNGEHNTLPSKAIDAIPVEYKDGKATVDWNDTNRIIFFAGFVVATAISMGIKLRWGGDWNSDTNLKDNKFNDFVHFELAD